MRIIYMIMIASVGAITLAGINSVAGSDNMMMEYTSHNITSATAIVDSSEYERIVLTTGAHISTNGSSGAFGYGLITTAGLDAIIVTTTHAGVKDSIAQVDSNDASFHNHYVGLHEVDDDAKCPGLEVKNISFQEPGDVEITDNMVVIEDTPFYFGATHSLSGDNISFNSHNIVHKAVSFTINPVDGDGNTSVTDIQAVCINDVSLVDVTSVPASYWEN